TNLMKAFGRYVIGAATSHTQRSWPGLPLIARSRPSNNWASRAPIGDGAKYAPRFTRIFAKKATTASSEASYKVMGRPSSMRARFLFHWLDFYPPLTP